MRRYNRYSEYPDRASYHTCIEPTLPVSEYGLSAVDDYIASLEEPLAPTHPLAVFRAELSDTVEAALAEWERDAEGYAAQAKDDAEAARLRAKRAEIGERIGLAAENVTLWLLAVWKGEIDATPAQVAAAVALRDLAE